jgi:hypothetical protein
MKKMTISLSREEAEELWQDYRREVLIWYLGEHPSFIVRLEAWDENGNNVGYRSETLGNHSEEEALLRAKQIWKSLYVGRKKELKVYGSLGIVITHRNYGTGSTKA